MGQVVMRTERLIVGNPHKSSLKKGAGAPEGTPALTTEGRWHPSRKEKRAERE